MELFQTDSVKNELIIGEFNKEANDYLAQDNWPHFAVIFYGNTGVGKSFLSEHYDLSEFGNIELLEGEEDEVQLFNIYNELRNMEGQRLIVTSSKHPDELKFALPDLTTRLKECPAIQVNQPDNEDIKKYTIMCFVARQLKVNDEVIEYILKRVNRDFNSINELIWKLDDVSIEESRNVTIPLIRDILG